MRVRILSLPLRFFDWVFHRWIYGLALEASIRKFESCHLDFSLAEKLKQAEQTAYIREVIGSSPISATFLEAWRNW